MCVLDFMELFVDSGYQEFEVFNTDQGEVVFSGYLEDLPDELQFEEVISIDNICSKYCGDKITLNI